MHTESRALDALDMKTESPTTKFLSFAMTALRFTISRQKHSRQILKSSRDNIITLDEVSWHDNEKDCWVVIYDRVYDLTDFIYEHPGGAEVLLEYAGRDATIAFRGVGHSPAAIQALDQYRIGELPSQECIFRTDTGIILSGVPI